MARISKPPEERKEEIILIAKELFFTKGYANTSISDIVSKVGVAKGLFYYYFKSKEEVFQSVMEIYANEKVSLFKTYIDDENLSLSEKIYMCVDNLYSTESFPVDFDEIFTSKHQELYDKLSLLIADSLVHPFFNFLYKTYAHKLNEIDIMFLTKFLVYGVIGISRVDSHSKFTKDDIVKNLELLLKF